MKIILIRHGMTKGNLNKCYIGATDESLCDEGKERLLEQSKNGIYIDADILFSSPMKRCLETAKLIYDKHTPIVIDNYRECNFGLFEGKNYKQLEANPLYKEWIDSNGTMAFPDGESKDEFQQRCVEGFKEMLSYIDEDNRDITIACIVHGGTIMSILDEYGTENKKYFDYQCNNGEGYICDIAYEEGEIRLECIQPLVCL